MNALGFPSILCVKGFAEISESRSWLRDMWDKYTWLQEGDFLADADGKLDLGGELLEYVAEHGIKWLPQPPGTQTNTTGFLGAHSENGLYQSWSEPTQSGCRYTVFVDYHDHSKAIKTDAALQTKVKDVFIHEMADALVHKKDDAAERDIVNAVYSSVMYKCGISYKNFDLLLKLTKI